MTKKGGAISNWLNTQKAAARQELVDQAEGLQNSEGKPLVENPLFKAGLNLLTPSEPNSTDVQTHSQIRAVKSGLQGMIQQAKERAETE